MGSTTWCERLAEVGAADVSSMSEVEVMRFVRSAERLASFVQARIVHATRRLAELQACGRSARPDVLLGAVVGKAEAGRLQRRAELLDEAPAMATAFEGGEITTAHVDALVGAVKQMPPLVDLEGDLARFAVSASPDRFREHCRLVGDLAADDGGVGRFERQRAATRLRRRVDGVTGMHHFELIADPERGARFGVVIDRIVEHRFHSGAHAGLDNDQRAALALFDLIAGRGPSTGEVQVALNVVIDVDTLVDGLHERSLIDVDGGAHLPVETIRRLGCDAQIMPIVLNGHSQVIDVGRSQRMATAKQRAALRAMHPTCAIPGCAVAFEHCNVHHARWWRHGGPTDLGNLVPLCSRHHHDAHEGGWQLAIGPDRAITWTGPRAPPHAA